MRERASQSGPGAGFSFVELLITVIILAVVMLLGFPALQNMIRRGKIEGLARETSLLMQQARYTAIRHTVNTSVVADLAGDRILAHRDPDRDGVLDAGEQIIGGEAGLPLPNGVYFWGAPDNGSADPAPEGPNAIDGLDEDASHGWVIFNTDGSIAKDGGIRLGDQRGNFLEVRIAPPATARVAVRKWDPNVCAGSPPVCWREQGELNRSWTWN